jgi:hypothetical protein
VCCRSRSRGAGSGAQHAVGTGVIGGMLTSTLLAVFFVPVFFVVVLRGFRVRPTKLPGVGSRPLLDRHTVDKYRSARTWHSPVLGGAD